MSLDVPGGTSDVIVGAQRQIIATAYEYAWEVWEDESGNAHLLNYTGGPCANASVIFSSGGGGFSTSGGNTDGSGATSTTFTMGMSEPVAVSVTAANPAGSATAGASVVFSPPVPEPETWEYLRTENLLSATATGGGVDVPEGETRQIQLHVRYDTWEVWAGSYGGVQIRNPSTSPASNAAVSWSVESGGSAPYVFASGFTDANGDAAVAFTMGSSIAVVRADVEYAGSSTGAANASVTFSPAAVEHWEYHHTEGYISASLSSDVGLAGVSAGTQAQITADVQYTSWEIWVSDWGNTTIKPQTTGPAIGAAVTFSASGDGAISAPAALTDLSGKATATFTMGGQDSHVMVAASFAGGAATASLDFSPPSGGGGGGGDGGGGDGGGGGGGDDPPEETWAWESDGGAVYVTASGGGVSVAHATWVVEVSNLLNHRTRNIASGTAINAPVSFSVSNGDAVITSSDSSTNSSGAAACSVAGGSQVSTITVSASFAGMSGSASFTVGAADSDGDGFSDAAEHTAGTDRNNPNSKPPLILVYLISETEPETWIETGSSILWEDNWHYFIPLPLEIFIMDGVYYGLRIRWKYGSRIHFLAGQAKRVWSDGTITYPWRDKWYNDLIPVEDGPHFDIWWTE